MRTRLPLFGFFAWRARGAAADGGHTQLPELAILPTFMVRAALVLAVPRPYVAEREAAGAYQASLSLPFSSAYKKGKTVKAPRLLTTLEQYGRKERENKDKAETATRSK